jgi:hypothetical protein
MLKRKIFSFCYIEDISMLNNNEPPTNGLAAVGGTRIYSQLQFANQLLFRQTERY